MILDVLSNDELNKTFFAIFLLLIFSFSFGKLFEHFNVPKVVGEITGGMILGSSCLYHFFPNFIGSVFQAYPEEGKVLNIFYQLGLVFLMFSSGFNTKIELQKENRQTIVCLFTGATVLPILGALPFVTLFMQSYIGANQNTTAFLIVFLISISITSIPVISKIFFDMGIMNTKFSNIILTVSTFQDLFLWIFLNLAINLVQTGKIVIAELLIVVITTLGVFVIAHLLTARLSNLHLFSKIKTDNYYSLSFIILFAEIVIMSFAKINIMYSAFIAGFVIKSFIGAETTQINRMKAVTNFSFAFFVPIYFALVGIQLDILHNFSFIRFLLFFFIAFSLEAIGICIMLYFTNLSKKAIINFAITMNARGGPCIVLASVGYYYKIINLEFFTVLILTAMLSSLIAGYWLRYQQKNNPYIFMDLVK